MCFVGLPTAKCNLLAFAPITSIHNRPLVIHSIPPAGPLSTQSAAAVTGQQQKALHKSVSSSLRFYSNLAAPLLLAFHFLLIPAPDSVKYRPPIAAIPTNQQQGPTL